MVMFQRIGSFRSWFTSSAVCRLQRLLGRSNGAADRSTGPGEALVESHACEDGGKWARKIEWRVIEKEEPIDQERSNRMRRLVWAVVAACGSVEEPGRDETNRTEANRTKRNQMERKEAQMNQNEPKRAKIDQHEPKRVEMNQHEPKRAKMNQHD